MSADDRGLTAERLDAIEAVARQDCAMQPAVVLALVAAIAARTEDVAAERQRTIIALRERDAALARTVPDGHVRIDGDLYEVRCEDLGDPFGSKAYLFEVENE